MVRKQTIHQPFRSYLLSGSSFLYISILRYFSVIYCIVRDRITHRLLNNAFGLSHSFNHLLLRNSQYLLQQVCLLNGLQHILLGRLLGLSTQQELIQDKVGLLKVEDNIQLTHLGGHNATQSSRSEGKRYIPE